MAGQSEPAADPFLLARKGRSKVLGPRRPHTLAVLACAADAQRAAGRAEAALSNLRSAVDGYPELAGDAQTSRATVSPLPVTAPRRSPDRAHHGQSELCIRRASCRPASYRSVTARSISSSVILVTGPETDTAIHDIGSGPTGAATQRTPASCSCSSRA